MTHRFSLIAGTIACCALASLPVLAQSVTPPMSGSPSSPPPESVERGMPKIGIKSEFDSDKGAGAGFEKSAGTSGTSQSSGRTDFNSSLSGPSPGSPSPGSTGVTGGPTGGMDK
ncbi:MAG TPA: hypothetical protein VJ692_09545 [Nitrospiraceae bacterium]|nr:hypothetical protein [Nitrospiraceae bacterium]